MLLAGALAYIEGFSKCPWDSNVGTTETAEILAFSGSLSRVGCFSQVA